MFTFNTTVEYSCNPGYTLVGTTKRLCQANQTWTGSLPQCRSKTFCCFCLFNIHCVRFSSLLWRSFTRSEKLNSKQLLASGARGHGGVDFAGILNFLQLTRFCQSFRTLVLFRWCSHMSSIHQKLSPSVSQLFSTQNTKLFNIISLFFHTNGLKSTLQLMFGIYLNCSFHYVNPLTVFLRPLRFLKCLHFLMTRKTLLLRQY